MQSHHFAYHICGCCAAAPRLCYAQRTCEVSHSLVYIVVHVDAQILETLRHFFGEAVRDTVVCADAYRLASCLYHCVTRFLNCDMDPSVPTVEGTLSLSIGSLAARSAATTFVNVLPKSTAATYFISHLPGIAQVSSELYGLLRTYHFMIYIVDFCYQVIFVV